MTAFKINFGSMQAKCASALALAMLAILSFSSAVLASDLAADALPTGGQVEAGQATISQSAATMNVNQTSQRAVVNWQSFNVGSNAQVNFNQPNAQAVTLNRVTGSGASQIDGAIRANGQVIIVNSNGVSFGKGAQVDAAAVVATTMNISNQDFMDGKHVYQGNGTGKVVNEGRITAHDAKGFIALLAPEVRNEGYLIARANVANTIAMVAGEKITLNFQNNQLIGVRVDVSTVNALVENKRLVFVDGGTVIVAANSARQLMNGVVKNSGVMVASSAVNNGGKIELVAAEVTNTGKLLANGKGTGATGGQINVAGENIVLASGSKIAANGAAGGGKINVGKKAANASNNEPALTAKNVRVESTAVLSASAINSGNGGTVQIHSTEQTQIHGIISANGGAISGNGGVIQTSSSGTLVVGSSAQVNVAATNGQPGTWKLQAGQLNIDRNMANIISQTLDQAHVALTAIANNLFAGDIHQDADAAIQKTAGANNTTLSLLADGEINIQGQITALLNAPLTVEMVANQVKLQSTANIAAYNIGINAVSSFSIWGNLFGQGSNPFVNVLAGVFNLFGAISANNTNGQGGKVRVNANNINLNSRSRIEANGQNGGEVILVASDTIEIQNAEIQTNGSNGRGGSISISGAQKTLLASATISAVGLEQGGKILIGNDAKNGTLPFSVYTDIDALTIINAGQINPNSFAGGFIETSGQTLGLLAAINAGRGGMWLLDPFDYVINATNASFINTALNAGTSVTITTSTNTSTCGASSCTTGGATGQNGDITVTSAISKTTATGSPTLTLIADRNIIISAAIGNTAGTLNLTLNAGGSISGSGALSVSGTKTFNVGADAAGIYSGVISGGGVIKSGAGKITFTGVNTYTGTTQINNGVLAITGTGKVSTNANGTEAGNGRVITVNTGAVLEFDNWDWGGNFGTAWYNNANLVINGGTLRYVGLANSGSPRGFTVNSTGAIFEALNTGVTWTLTRSGSVNEQSIMGGPVTLTGAGNGAMGQVIAGAYTVTKNGTGTWTLNAVNTYTGATNINAGTLVVGGAGQLGSGTYAGAIAIANAATFAYSSSANNTFSGLISGAGSVVKNTGATSVVTLSGANTYSGGTSILAGVIKAGNASALGSAGVTIGANANSLGTLDLNGLTITNNLTLNGGGATGAITNGSTTAARISGAVTLNSASTIDGANAITLSGVVTSNGHGLGFVGAGTYTLNNPANTLSIIATHTTPVAGLNISNSGELSVGSVVVNAVTYSGLRVVGNLTMNSALRIGANITTGGTQTYMGAVTLTADAVLATFTGGTGTTQANKAITFSSTLNGASGLVLTNGSGATTFNGEVGGVSALASLTTGTGATTVRASVTTTGAQTYGGNVLLGGSGINFNTTNSDVTITGTVSNAFVAGTQANLIQFLGGGAYNYNGLTYSNLGSTYTGISIGGTATLAWDGSAYSFTSLNSYTGVQYLVVGAGGAGGVGVSGSIYGSGGGGGQVLSGSSATLAASTSYSVTVGAGGISSSNTAIASGGSSSVLTYTALGGLTAGYTTRTGGASGSGFAAGTGSAGVAGGGGGGAGGAASVMNGGAGVASSITGVSTSYGGGGASQNWTTLGTASAGGGYWTSATVVAQPTVNSGGGGAQGSNGATGVVMLAYGGNMDNSLTINAGTGKATITGGTTNLDNLVVNSSSSGSVITGAITGATNLVKTCTGTCVPVLPTVDNRNQVNGTLTLVANNTYTGTTTISSGTIRVGNNTATGSIGSGAFTNNGNLTFYRNAALTYSATFSGSGSITQQGSAALTLSAANIHTGGTYVEASSTLIATNLGALGTGAVTIRNAGVLDLKVAGTFTLGALNMVASSSITNSSANSSLVVSGTSNLFGTVTTNGTQTYNDAVTVGGTSTLTTTNAAINFNSTIASGINEQVALQLLGAGAYKYGSTITGTATATATTLPNGATLTYSAGNYAWMPSATVSADYLVVGGGGGGSRGVGSVNYGAGAGGGQVLTGVTNWVAGTTYTISVGAGGLTPITSGTTSSTVLNTNYNGRNGGASIISAAGLTTLTAAGGFGSVHNSFTGSNSGGNLYLGALGTGSYGAGGGGGAGGNAVGNTGGIGVTSSITGTAVEYGAGGCGSAGAVCTNATPLANSGRGAADTSTAPSPSGGSGIVAIAMGTLNLPVGLTLNSGTAAATLSNNINNINLTVNSTSTTSAITGVVSGSGSFTYNNAATYNASALGVINLTQANTYSGGTLVSAGKLVVGDSSAMGTGAVTVGSANTSVGSVDLNGYSVTNVFTLNGGAAVGALINSSTTSASTASGAITVASNASLGGAGSLTLSGAVSTSTFGIAFVGSGHYTLNNAANRIDTIGTSSATAIGSLTLVNNRDLTIGSVSVNSVAYNVLKSNGAVSITANSNSTTTAITSAVAMSASSLSLIGSATTASTIVSLTGTITINAGGSNLTVVANNTAAGGNTGINATGTITNNADGGNISFTSNNKINQTGAISLVANTSGTAANVTYDTTRGSNLSTIASGALTIGASSTSDINLTIKSAGSSINPAAIGTSTTSFPGTVTLDNTYGCTGVSCTPETGFITASNLTTYAALNVVGITINNAIYTNKTITINGVTQGNSVNYQAVRIQSPVTSANGDITITGLNDAGWAITNGISGVGFNTAPLKAVNGTVTLTGVATTTGSGVVYGSTTNGLITAKVINVTGTTATGTYGAFVTDMTIVAGGGDITVIGNVGAATINGIYQVSSTITNNASGSNMTFRSNGFINQTGTISVVANVSANPANIIYDTTRGNKSSTITSAALTIAAGSTSDINYTVTTAGANINTGAIGSASVSLPGTVTLDNTYGCISSGCTPASGFINATNLITYATTGYGVTVNSVIYTTKNITVKGASNASRGIDYSAIIKTTSGDVSFEGLTTTNYGIYGTTLITANNISMNGYATGTVGGYLVQAQALTINSGSVGGSITITGMNATAGDGNGIYQSGAITLASGSNMTFTTNNKLSQNGAIAVAANTSGTAANFIYDTTTGTKLSTVIAGAMSIATGSTDDINYTIKTAGANISPGAIGSTTIVLPGSVMFDNTYGCNGASCTPVSGFITATNLSTYATTGAGVTLNQVIYSNKAITVKGVANGSQGIVSSAIVKANTGNINLYGVGVAHRGVEYSASITALAGDVVMTGITNSNYGIYTSNASLIQANNITLTGSANAAWNGWLVQAGAFKINSIAVGGSISVTATGVTAGGGYGLYQSGDITLASGSNMTFITNNTLSQNGAIAVAVNNTGIAANFIYDTTTGTKLSTVIAGAMTIATGSTSDINYTIKTAGANITPGVIGSATVALPGNVTLDNTYGCTGASCTPAAGFVTAANAATYATTSSGVTLNQVIYATKNVTVTGTASAHQGVNYSAIIKTTGGNVVIIGSTTTNYGIYGTSSITANNITLTGNASGTVAGYLVQVDAMTINSGSVGGSIVVTGMNATAGGGNGIYQTAGAITGANGTSISFISNNKINQAGAITLVANTSSAVANIIYDTTSGNKLSTILGVDISVPAGSAKAVNYTMKSAGAALDPVVNVPGSIVLDNTYGCTGTGCTPVSGFINLDNAATYATAGDAVTVGALSAGTGITLRGVSSGARGVYTTGAMNSTTGDVTIVGYTTASGQRAVDLSAASSIYAADGNISITSARTATSTYTTLYMVGTSASAPIILSASGTIDMIGYAPTSGSAILYTTNVLMVSGGDMTISASGAGGTTYGAVDFSTTVMKAGGDLTIQGASKLNGEAVGVIGSSATGVKYGVSLTSYSTMTIAAGKVNAGTYGNISATGAISIDATATGNSGTAFYATTGNLSSGGLMTIIGRAVTGTGIVGVNTTATTALSSAGGIAISGIGSVGGTTGNIAMLGSITNTGTTGTGITISSTYNTSVANVTNSGANGMRITGGAGIAAGVTTAGTIKGLGTLTNTGGVMALSMAEPGATTYTLEGKIALTTANASSANVRYSVAGGNFTNPSTYSSGNFINYRSGLGTYTVSATIGNYSAVYGTAYDDTTALSWLRTGSNVTLTASSLPFGISAAEIKAGLVWNSTIGASALNANAVQTSTALNAGSIKTADGNNVTIATGTPTYTITKANLTITNNASTSTYNGTSTYANLVSAAGYTLSGLVTSIGGVSTGDAVTSVTQTIKSGAVVASGNAVTGVAQAGSFNAVPSAAVGVGLANYNITYTGVASTVSQAAITITASDLSKVYGNTASSLAYTVTAGQLIGSDAITGLTFTSLGSAATATVGTYTITPSAALGVSNYSITYADGVMTVTPKPITVTANNVTTAYGTVVNLGSSANFSTAAGALVNGDSISTVTLAYNSASTIPGTVNAGSYSGVIAASAAVGTGLNNYTITYATGSLVVNQKALTVSLNNQTKVYDATAFATLTTGSYVLSGFAAGESATINQTVGTYNSANVASATTVTAALTSTHYVAGSGTLLNNYILPTTASTTVGGGTITPATLTITADSQAKFIGQVDPSFTYTYSGLKGTDTISVATGIAVNADRSTTSPAYTGVMPVAGGEAAGTTYVNALVPSVTALNSNYVLSPVKGDFTIAAAGQLIVKVGNTSISYGTYTNTTNLATAVSPSVTAIYCKANSSCGAGDIQTLTNSSVTSTGTNMARFVAFDALTPAGTIQFDVALDSSVLAASYSTGNFLNVGEYSIKPSNALPVGSTINYIDNDARYPIIYTSGKVSVTPVTLTVSNSSAPTKQYDTTTSMSSVVITPTNKQTDDVINLSGFGTFNSASAGNNLNYSINNIQILGADAANYVLASTSITGTNGTITKAPVTISGLAASNKVYDANNTATLTGTASAFGLLGSDTSTVTGSATATFNSVNVADGIAVTPRLSGLTLGNGNYEITGVTSALSANITPAPITVTAAKVYDGSLSVANAGLTVAGVAGQTLSFGAVTTATLTNPNVNSAALSTLNNVTLENGTTGTVGLASNYTLVNPIYSTVTITPASITVSASNAVKTYDTNTGVVGATTAPAPTLVSGTLYTNAVTGLADRLSGGVFTYSDANASTGNKSLQVAGVSVLNGTVGASANYSIAYQDNTTSTINQKSVTVSGLSAANKVYNGSDAAVISGTPTVNGLLGADTASVIGTITSGTFNDVNAANNIGVSLVLSGLSLNNANYVIAGTTAGLIANITPATVTLTATKVYDGTNSLTGSQVIIGGLVGTETLTYNTATVDNVNAGSSFINGITLANGNNGGLASNYALPSLTAASAINAVTITKAALLVTANNKSMTYGDSNLPVLTATITGFVNGETASVVSGEAGLTTTATAYDGTVGSASVVDNYTITAALGTLAAANYSFTYTAGTLVVNKANLTITADVDSKVYGSTTTTNGVAYVSGVATGATSGFTNVGLVNGDTLSSVTLASLGGNTTANVVNGPFTITPSAAAGSTRTTSSNYTITYVAANNGLTVTPKQVSFTGSATKVYDGTTALSGVSVSTGVGSETLLLSNAAANSADVGSGNFISAGTLVNGTGANGGLASNYTLPTTLDASTAPFNITKAVLTVTADNQIMTYGDISLPSLTATITGFVNGETASVVSGAAALTTTANAYNGTAGSASTAGNYTIAPALGTLTASNYSFTYEDGSLTVNKASLTITAADDTKVYGATTTGAGVAYVSGVASGATLGFTHSGLVNGDTLSSVTLTSAGANATANVVDGPFAITPSGALGSTRTTTSNYDITYVPATTGLSVIAKTLTLNGTTATKVYDGTTTLAGSDITISGLIGNETLTYTGATANSANVGSGNYITGMTLADGTGLASNYLLPTLDANNAAVSITPKALSIAAVKTYDATTGLSGNQVTITGMVGSETLDFSGAAANDANVATANKYFNAMTLVDGTGLASNYALPSLTAASASNTVTINPLTVTLNSSTATKVYDGNTSLTGNQITISGLIGSETLTYTGAIANSANVGAGNYITGMTLADGTGLASNYLLPTLDASNAPVTITPKAVSIAGVKTYDATTGLSGNQVTITGLVGTQTLNFSGAAANDANVATANNYFSTMILADGTNGGLAVNYALPSLTTASANNIVSITAKAVSIAGVKTYDATTGLSGNQVTITGMVGSETLDFSGAAANDANVATANKYFNAMTLVDGTGLASNYALPSLTAASTSNTVTINPLTVTLNGTTATKVYDGTTTLTGSDITISGLIGNETLTYTAATANSANVGSGNYITGMTLADGTGLASNYLLPTLDTSNAPVQITKANLALIGTKVYDGTVLFLASSMAVTGVNGETFSVSGEALLTHKNVQTNQMLSGVSRLLLAETSSGLLSNYNELTANQTSVSVSVKPINVTVPVITKVYDGTFTYTLNAADLSAMTSQLMGADSFSSATVIYNGNDKNVGENKPITLTSVTINDDNNGGNYSVTYINSGGAISRAPLRVTAVNDAKFVSQTDNSQYAGVLYSGFVNGEASASLGGALSFTRTNAAVNTVGNYVGVLQPAGLTSSNYQITFVPGNYTIVAAENLLVRASANSTYGSAPSYQLTAQYLAADNTTLSYIGFNGTSPSPNVINLTATANRSGIATFTLVDGLVGGTAATISIGPDSTTLSGSSNINAGQYNVESAAAPTFNSASPSFKGVTVVGQLTVSPMIITSPTLGANSITKEYDGNAVISGNAISTSTSSSQLLAGDLASITATGIYSDKNVANGKSVTVNFGLAGTNASNYVMSSTQVTGNYGQITQRNSVTYVGASGGDWSTASNWTGGAIPDYANVANVVIPTNTTVNFDNSVGGTMTSAIQNNGRININLSSDKTFANTITGNGVLEISNVGVVTLTGNNTYSGGTILNAGTTLVAGSNNALGTAVITSNGTAADPARFMTTSNVVLPSLTLTGGTTKLMSSITTLGAQSYADLILGVSGTTTLASSNANISLLGKVDSALNKTNNLVINAGTANVTIGDSIGSVARFNNLTVTSRAIYILADVLTGMTQTYNGSVLIGDASFLGRTPTVGFLLSNYRSYFEYTANGRSSAIDYLNRDPIYIRTLISVDPEITFNGAVNDVVANTHTLLVAAIAPTSPASNPAALNGAAVINFNDSVGQEAPLYSVNVQTVLNNSQNNADAYLGSINLTGNVATYGSQTYRANMMTAKSNPQPGEVVFSVWDPAANITYLLPLQDTTNSNCTSNCGQMNLQNPNSVDAIKFNGNNNFIAARNSTGVNNWGTRFTQANALGYVPPPARSNSEFMNYAKFIQRDVQYRMMKLVDDGDERNPAVSVGEAQVDDGTGVDCSSLRKNKKALLPPECRTTKN